MAMILRALLCAALAAPLGAAEPAFPKCPPAGSTEKPSLHAVIACQQAGRASYAEEHRKRFGREPAFHLVDRLDDYQRAEMRAFLQEHPEAATFEEPEAKPKAAPEPDEPQGVLQQLGVMFGLAKEKLAALFGGGEAKKPAPAEGELRAMAEKIAAQAARAGAVQKVGTQEDGSRPAEGLDLNALRKAASDDPAKSVGEAVQRYNRDFKSNLDPSMHKFFKKPGESAPE